jgi:hypothetical protein
MVAESAGTKAHIERDLYLVHIYVRPSQAICLKFILKQPVQFQNIFKN